MRQTEKSIFTEQRDIRKFAGNHDVMTNIKIKKTDVKTKLKDGILPCGLPISKAGKFEETTPIGILFNDVDFNGIKDEETATASVLIHGFVDEEKAKKYSGESEIKETVKTALKGAVQFL